MESPPLSDQKNFCRLTCIIIIISLSSFYFGFSLTYLETISDAVLIEFYGNVIEESGTRPVLTGAMPIGAIFGSLFANILMKRFTRR